MAWHTKHIANSVNSYILVHGIIIYITARRVHLLINYLLLILSHQGIKEEEA